VKLCLRSFLCVSVSDDLLLMLHGMMTIVVTALTSCVYLLVS
jgi:hypothetical protein